MKSFLGLLAFMTVFVCQQVVASNVIPPPKPFAFYISEDGIKQDVPVKISTVGSLSTVTFDCGITRTGLQRLCNTGFGSYSGIQYTFSAGSFVQPPNFVLLSDGCSGATISNGQSCNIQWRFTPTSIGVQSVSASFSWNAVDLNTSLTSSGTSTIVLNARGNRISPVPRRSKITCGSTISVDAQVLGETIPIVGVDWNLSYSSLFASSFRTYDGLVRPTYMSPEKWDVSIQHFYDKSVNKIYKGTGYSEYLSHQVLGSGHSQVVSADGEEVYIFNSSGRHLETKRSLTGEAKYLFFYDGSSRILKIEDAFGNETNFIRNGTTGFLEEIIAPYGQVTTITLDSNDWVSEVTNPNGESYQVSYKSGTDLLETFTKPGGQVSTFSYDLDGRLTQDLGNGGNFWSFVTALAPSSLSRMSVTQTSQMGRSTNLITGFNASNHYVRTETSPYGQQTFYTEFSSGNFGFNNGYENIVDTYAADQRISSYKRKTQTTRTISGTTSTTSFGQTVAFPSVVPDIYTFDSITRTKTTSGRTFTEVFDNALKKLTATSPEGATEETVIDVHERPVSRQIGTDTAWSFVYDTNGRPQLTSQGSKNSVTFTYNADGFVQKTTNARNEETSFLYDLAGRVSQVTLPDLRTIQYSYDDNGNMIGITPSSRPQHVFTFNAFEMVDTYEPPSVSGVSVLETSYAYNNDKQLTQVTRPDGQYALYNYDSSKGILNSVTQASFAQNYTYYTNSNRVQKIETSDDIRNTFSYFGNMLLSEQQHNTSSSFMYAKVTYGFDANFRKTSRSLQGNSSSPTSVTNITYNDDDMPEQIGDLALTYTYPSGRLSQTVLNQISDVRTYDSYGQLESYTAIYTPTSGPVQDLYSYTLTRDVASRISSKVETILGVTDTYVYTYDSAGRLTVVTKNTLPHSSYTYDSNGNRTSGTMNGSAFTATYDNQDRLLTHNTQTYEYSDSGDLNKIEYSPTSEMTFVYDALGNLKESVLTDGRIVSYGIDGLNQRVFRKVNGSTDVRSLYSDRNRIIAQYGDAGVIAKEYVYGLEHISPDYMIVGGVNYRFIKDHLGSPRLIVKATDGTIVQRLDYTEFGKETTNTNPGYQPYGFAGGIVDVDTGLIRFGARDYDPTTGRWTAKDPILFEGGDANLFGYVANDPINFIDPNGTTPLIVPIATTATGATVGAIGGWANSKACSNSGKFGDALAGAITGGIGGFFAGVYAPGVGIFMDIGTHALGANFSGADMGFGSGCPPPPPCK